MSETEPYVTKRNPSIEDWLDYNEPYFATLRGEPSDEPVNNFAILTDIDTHAEARGVSTEELFEEVKGRVGSLGELGLKLVHVAMDQSAHVTLERQ